MLQSLRLCLKCKKTQILVKFLVQFLVKNLPSIFNSSSSWHKIQVNSFSVENTGLLRFGPKHWWTLFCSVSDDFSIFSSISVISWFEGSVCSWKNIVNKQLNLVNLAQNCKQTAYLFSIESLAFLNCVIIQLFIFFHEILLGIFHLVHDFFPSFCSKSEM